MTPDRKVSAEALLAQGIKPQDVRHITGNQPEMPWHQLARIDGALALAVLTNDEFDLIRQELARAGLPAAEERTREDVLALIWTVAGNDCPTLGTPWYSVDLQSAVACAQMLTLVQQAWSFDEKLAKQRELESFGKLLGVPAANVEPI
jgi:hypothetical protein